MKVQVLYFSKAGNATTVGDGIARHLKCKQDAIPPAYPAENEKIVFIAVEGKNAKPDKKVVAFCKDLTPARAKNVAFIIVSTSGTEGCSTLSEILKGQGVNVVDSFECKAKSKLFGVGPISDADVAACKAWAQKVVDALSE